MKLRKQCDAIIGAAIWGACKMLRDFAPEIRILQAPDPAPFNDKAVEVHYRYTNFVSNCPGSVADLLEDETCRALI